MVASAVFVATLGSEPQVVTIALQLLLASGVTPARAVIVHTNDSAPLIRDAITELRKAFSTPLLQHIRLELHPLCAKGIPLVDIASVEQAHSTFRHMFLLIKQIKSEGHQIHLSVAGGRKIMAIYGLAVAQMLFEEDDVLYYLFSKGALAEERRLFLQEGDQAELVPIPFLRWSSESAAISEILRYDDPLEALAHGSPLARQREHQRWVHFVEHILTEAERQVASLVVSEGLTNVQVAQRLGRSPKTVANQLTSIYGKLAACLSENAARGVDRHLLTVILHDCFPPQIR